MFRKMIDELKGEAFPRAEYPALYKSLDRFAKKLGTAETPTVYLASPKLEKLMPAPFAGAAGNDTIIVNRAFLGSLNIIPENLSEMLGTNIHEGFEAIMAHEMHHCGNHRSLKMLSRTPLFALPAAALVGTYLYGRAHKKNPDGDKKAIHDSIVKDSETIQKSLDRGTGQSDEVAEQAKSVVHAGHYIGAALAGIGAGLVACRYGARFHEFAADKFMAENANKAAGMEVIENITNLIEQAEARVKDMGAKPSNFMTLLQETVGAHPSVAERKAAIGL